MSREELGSSASLGITGNIPEQLDLFFQKLKNEKVSKLTKPIESINLAPSPKASAPNSELHSPVKGVTQLHVRLSKFRNRQSNLNNKLYNLQQTGKFHLGVFFSIIGKTLGYVRKTKEKLKYSNFSNLTKLQLQLINDKAYPESCFESKKDRSKSKGANLLFFLLSFLFSFGKLKWPKKIIKRIKVFDPSNRLILLWKTITCLLIFFEIFSITIELFFKQSWIYLEFQDTARSYLFIVLIIDFLISLNTGIYESGSVIYNRRIIFKNYISSNFIQDSLSLISLVYIYEPYSADFDQKYPALMNNWYTITRLIFSLKLGQVTNILKSIEDSLFNDEFFSGILALVKLCLQILFLTHLASCLWTLSAISESKKGNISWIQKRFENEDIFTMPWYRLYIYSVYWSLATIVTVGYGDIAPQNDSEVLVSCFCMLFGSGFFAYSINTMGFIVEKFDVHKKNLRKDLLVINKYMKNAKVDYELQVRIRKYLEHLWLREDYANKEVEKNVLTKLSSSLRKDLLSQSRGRMLAGFTAFTNFFSKEILEKISGRVKAANFAPDELIYDVGNRDENSVYFLTKGHVELYIRSPAKNSSPLPIMQLKEGDCFGQLGFFTEKARAIGARSVGFSTVFMMEREDFLEILKPYPEDFENFCYIKDNIILYQDLSGVGVNCHSCGEDKHFISNCPYIRYVPNKDLIIRKHLYSEPNLRQPKLKRRNNRTPNALLIKFYGQSLQSITNSQSSLSSENESTKKTTIIHGENFDINYLTKLIKISEETNTAAELEFKFNSGEINQEERKEHQENSIKNDELFIPLRSPINNNKLDFRRRKSELKNFTDFKMVTGYGEEKHQTKIQTEPKRGDRHLTILEKLIAQGNFPERRKTHPSNQESSQFDLQKNQGLPPDIPLIFGGLNTEKMATFQIYFPYNNADHIIKYIKLSQARKLKSFQTNKQNRSMMTNGLIHFRNQKRFYLKSKMTNKESELEYVEMRIPKNKNSIRESTYTKNFNQSGSHFTPSKRAEKSFLKSIENVFNKSKSSRILSEAKIEPVK